MEKEFIPYEQALELKELEFNRRTFATYSTIQNNKWILTRDLSGGGQYPKDTPACIAPTFSQAFRWFRENHNLKGHIEAVEYLDGTSDTYHWSIFNKCNSGYDQLTYEEAELACLKKLIEIVKQK